MFDGKALNPALAPPPNPTPEQALEAIKAVRHRAIYFQPPHATCDFCDARDAATWVYPARQISTLAGPIEYIHADPSWQACEACAALVEAKSYVALVERHINLNYPEIVGNERAFLARGLQALYVQFAKARSGDRIAFSKS